VLNSDVVWVLRVRDLRKSYGPVCAVAGVSFTVESGTVFALLGPNGAGKTTTVEILEGLRIPSFSVKGYSSGQILYRRGERAQALLLLSSWSSSRNSTT